MGQYPYNFKYSKTLITYLLYKFVFVPVIPETSSMFLLKTVKHPLINNQAFINEILALAIPCAHLFINLYPYYSFLPISHSKYLNYLLLISVFNQQDETLVASPQLIALLSLLKIYNSKNCSINPLRYSVTPFHIHYCLLQVV